MEQSTRNKIQNISFQKLYKPTIFSTDPISTLNSNKITCPYANRAVISLLEAGVDFEEILIDLENKPEWIKEVNPASKVPALRLSDGKILAESVQIAEFIAESYPESNLLPLDPYKRYEVRTFLEFTSSLGPLLYQLLNLAKSPRDEKTVDEKISQIVAKLRQVNEKLKEHSNEGPYFDGNHFSFADIIPFTIFERINIASQIVGCPIKDFEGLDCVIEWAKAIRARESYKKGVATSQEMYESLKSLLKRL
ncbi:hypothetical protein BB559_005526 [Furculomyces boomerangus]|uniref:GST N-terminal domain-containing protein n=2 Tax=Harpellales TaxID=61421 RepID=A0A2T9Y8D3_9FUNG|nr:hypothetical protein BB559_005526 [Furculomyces boomerangus]PVZ97546.1 hypothetical protein BB558_006492 [Smittium angustum]